VVAFSCRTTPQLARTERHVSCGGNPLKWRRRPRRLLEETSVPLEIDRGHHGPTGSMSMSWCAQIRRILWQEGLSIGCLCQKPCVLQSGGFTEHYRAGIRAAISCLDARRPYALRRKEEKTRVLVYHHLDRRSGDAHDHGTLLFSSLPPRARNEIFCSFLFRFSLPLVSLDNRCS